MRVDKTAEAILATEAPIFSSDTIADMVGQRIISDYHRELQAMAKLWLMKRQILSALEDGNFAAIEVTTKIEALDTK